MLLQLAQCEFAIGKTQTVFEMNELETENYEKIYNEIGEYKEKEINLKQIVQRLSFKVNASPNFTTVKNPATIKSIQW